MSSDKFSADSGSLANLQTLMDNLALNVAGLANELGCLFDQASFGGAFGSPGDSFGKQLKDQAVPALENLTVYLKSGADFFSTKVDDLGALKNAVDTIATDAEAAAGETGPGRR